MVEGLFPGINVRTRQTIYGRRGFSGRKRKDVLELRAFMIKEQLS